MIMSLALTIASCVMWWCYVWHLHTDDIGFLLTGMLLLAAAYFTKVWCDRFELEYRAGLRKVPAQVKR